MEYMSRGSLFQFMRKSKGKFRKLSLQRRLQFSIDIARAVAFLHSQQPAICHLDIKSLNCLIADDWTLKLSDFGDARRTDVSMDERLKSSVRHRGTVNWTAPELIKSSTMYSEKADIYSLGCLFWEIVTGRQPFDDVEAWRIPRLVCEFKHKPSLDLIPETTPTDYIDLIEICLSEDPEQRPEADAVVKKLEEMLEIFCGLVTDSTPNMTFGSLV
eukprot:TRINITY_DN8974_c0_g2_i1.p1 TRINITY_DN8974_c0_g2~~TRINITY_DN8974_c0_g2_i1.p1  ORF type:complete len:239 (-),score=72.86 TRINITY_DN8974_c0_g2_i1:552-1196(-)